MNETKRLTNEGAWVLCALLGAMLVWMLTGCTSCQERPGLHAAYDEPSAQVETSYAEIRTENDFYEPLSPYGGWEVVGSCRRIDVG